MKRKNTFPVRWANVFVLLTLHVVTIITLIWTWFHFSWWLIILAVLVEFVGHCLGVGIGLHRYGTHRGFIASTKLRRFFFLCACIAAQGNFIEWISTHVIHHLFTDKRQDPHTPRRGFWHAHVGWIIRKDPKLSQVETLQKYAPQLMKDKWLMRLNKYWYMPIVTLGVFLWLVFDLLTAIWGTILPITFGLHFTWLVNSATHIWGTRRYKTKDRSTNNSIVAVLTWGDGLHNNHHEDPKSVKHARKWRDADVSWYVVWLLHRMGIISNLQLPED